MSKMMEYIESALGYDAAGMPASTTQFTFGYAPFQIAETEDIAALTEITAMVQCDAIVEMKIIDDFVQVVFDFSMEVENLAELAGELESYQAQREHTTESMNRLMNELSLAQRNEDQDAQDELDGQIRSMSIPFLMPTIIPVIHGGTVHVGFSDDPKFIMFVSDSLNEQPYKLAMIFNVHDVFCQDELGVYTGDTEDEIREQQEEMWYMQEAKKAEEEAFQAQYGYTSSMAGNLYDDDDQNGGDKRMKGVRMK